jgi:hypothetical protein
MAWWFEAAPQLNGRIDLADHARSLGFRGEEALLTALWRDRLYVRRKEGDNETG